MTKIRVKIFILFVAFMLISSFGGIIFYYFQARAIFTKQTSQYLEAVSVSRAQPVKIFLKKYQELIHNIASQENINNLFATSIDSQDYFNSLDSIKIEFAKILKLYPAIISMNIVDRSGEVVYSTNLKEGEEEDLSDLLKNFLEEKNYVKNFHFHESLNKSAFDFGLPIKDINQKIVGGVIVDVDANELFDITLDHSALGISGEVYLINKLGLMITPSRFKNIDFTKQKVKTVNSEQCLRDLLGVTSHDYSENFSSFFNYSGAKVLGSHIPIPEAGWCLITEIKEQEVTGNLKSQLLSSALVILLAISVIMIIFIIISGKILEEFLNLSICKNLKEDKRK